MFQSSIGQVVWALLIVLAIVFAILGLYGICLQFGLLGRAGRGRAARRPRDRDDHRHAHPGAVRLDGGLGRGVLSRAEAASAIVRPREEADDRRSER